MVCNAIIKWKRTAHTTIYMHSLSYNGLEYNATSSDFCHFSNSFPEKSGYCHVLHVHYQKQDGTTTGAAAIWSGQME